MSWQQPDYYALLGVDRGVSPVDLDRAYRRAARATHPDVHPDDASAAERFHAVTIAYETLSDPQLRASYDHAHPPVRPNAPVRIVVHRRQPATVPPVHLERRRPRTEQLLTLGANRPPCFEADLFEIVEALSRMLGDWPFR